VSKSEELRAIAMDRHDWESWPWPDHNGIHSMSGLNGSYLYDGDCLRCHLELVAARELRAREDRV
jgi:hypothetical protein